MLFNDSTLILYDQESTLSVSPAKNVFEWAKANFPNTSREIGERRKKEREETESKDINKDEIRKLRHQSI